MEEEKKGEGFVVRDKRQFTETGESRQPEARTEAEPEQEKPEEKAEPAEKVQDAAGGAPPQEDLPEMTFSNLVLSLSTSAMFHFGDFADPVTKKTERNLLAAKQTIDILGMLQDKTMGNLNPDEKGILDAVLFELRMRYVKEKDKG